MELLLYRGRWLDVGGGRERSKYSPIFRSVSLSFPRGLLQPSWHLGSGRKNFPQGVSVACSATSGWLPPGAVRGARVGNVSEGCSDTRLVAVVTHIHVFGRAHGIVRVFPDGAPERGKM